MDLAQLANLGEFIGGVTVLATLIYLAVQVRDAKRQLDEQSLATANHSMMTSFDPIYLDGNEPVFRRGLWGEPFQQDDDAYLFEMLMYRQAASLVMVSRADQDWAQQMIIGLRELVFDHPGGKQWLERMPDSELKVAIEAALERGGPRSTTAEPRMSVR